MLISQSPPHPIHSKNHRLCPEATLAACTHLDEEKAVDSFTYGYLAGVSLLIADPPCFLCFPSSFIAQFKHYCTTYITFPSSLDPPSIPFVLGNFKCFVSIIRPVILLQDQVEEIILWKMGPRRTLIWVVTDSCICAF